VWLVFFSSACGGTVLQPARKSTQIATPLPHLELGIATDKRFESR
jgi:hypothetical protein